MKKKYVVALDAGTTSCRCIIFDREQNIVSLAQKEFPQIYPCPGWVEHNPTDIWVAQYSVLMEAIAHLNIRPEEIAAIGIANQRETVIVWDKNTGMPICNAAVWQCRRTAELCRELEKDTSFAAYIRETTGLRIDPYFSATKLSWILHHIPGAMEKAEAGSLLFGTVDTWLLWKLTEGASHATDVTNASRTMLFDIHRLQWDPFLLQKFGIPASMLPKVQDSASFYGAANIGGTRIPICGIAGDQQAALFGQACFTAGSVKNTYGTGNFILMNTGEKIICSSHGLLSTIAYGIDGKVSYALEGSVFIGGAVIQWLRDEMRFFRESSDADYFGEKAKDNGGVYFVPAFTGLGAPHWDMNARGCLFGMTRGTSRNQIIRAALEAIAFQSKDVIDAMAADTGLPIGEIKVDGGASVSDVIMQFQADISGAVLRRPMIRETTALGAAYLAGLSSGFWRDMDDLRDHWSLDKIYTPKMPEARKKKLLSGWSHAVACAKLWREDEVE